MKGPAGGAWGRVALCAIGVALAVPSGAAAAEFRVDGGHLTYIALPGEVNTPAQLHYDLENERWTFLELPALLTPGPGCELDSNPSIAYCEDSQEPLSASVDLGDRDDWYQQSDLVMYDGQTGVTTETPVEEPFSQVVEAGPGNDSFWANATGSPTTFQGGDGDDRFTFFTDGAGEPPVPPGTYRLLGGEGSDTMEVPWGAPPSPPPPGGVGLTMGGGGGNDTLRGSKGDDLIEGGEGDDHLWDMPGNDVVDGGPGDDQLYGGDGDDVQNGGDGGDMILVFGGSDRIDGGPGDDRINSKNSSWADEVNCGEGEDEVLPDMGLDLIGTDCERIVVPEECGSGPACISTITITTAQVPQPKSARVAKDKPKRRLLLGKARVKFRGSSRTGKLPLSRRGRAYVGQRGALRVLRTARIVKPRGKRRPAKVSVRRIPLTLKSP